jgi:hypothetical protein
MGGDKGESRNQGRAATLGLRDWDGRTADPSATLGMTKERVVGRGERLPNRNIFILISGPQAHDHSG